MLTHLLSCTVPRGFPGPAPWRPTPTERRDSCVLRQRDGGHRLMPDPSAALAVVSSSGREGALSCCGAAPQCSIRPSLLTSSSDAVDKAQIARLRGSLQATRGELDPARGLYGPEV